MKTVYVIAVAGRLFKDCRRVDGVLTPEGYDWTSKIGEATKYETLERADAIVHFWTKKPAMDDKGKTIPGKFVDKKTVLGGVKCDDAFAVDTDLSDEEFAQQVALGTVKIGNEL